MNLMPSDIRPGGNWNGKSTNFITGAEQSNLDSKMDFIEHQDIVFKSGAILVNMNFTQDEIKNNAAKNALATLKSLYNGAVAGTLYITKGIHQPKTNPHMQLFATIGKRDYTFHLYLSAEEIATDLDGLEHFHWTGVAFRGFAPNRSGDAYWPVDGKDIASAAIRKGETGMGDNKVRRQSISRSGIVGLNQYIVEERARVQAEIAATKANTDKQTNENAIIDKIRSSCKLNPIKRPNKHFWSGKNSAYFKSEKGETVTGKLIGNEFCYTLNKKDHKFNIIS